MGTPAKLASFGAGLVAVFGAALGVGSAVGPVGPPAEESSPAEHRPAPEDTRPAPGTPHEEHGP